MSVVFPTERGNSRSLLTNWYTLSVARGIGNWEFPHWPESNDILSLWVLISVAIVAAAAVVAVITAAVVAIV